MSELTEPLWHKGSRCSSGSGSSLGSEFQCLGNSKFHPRQRRSRFHISSEIKSYYHIIFPASASRYVLKNHFLWLWFFHALYFKTSTSEPQLPPPSSSAPSQSPTPSSSLGQDRPRGRLTLRLQRSAQKWEVIIFRDRQTNTRFIIIYIYRILHHRDHHKAAVSVGASPDLISWLDGWLPRWKRGRWG